MVPFLIGLLAVGLLLFMVRIFISSDPARLARILRQLFAVMLLLGAILLIASNRYAILAVPLLLYALCVLFNRQFPFFSKKPDRRASSSAFRTGRSASHMTTVYFEMSRDHATGAMFGLVLAGHFEGRRLIQLSESELAMLYNEIYAHHPEEADSLRLLETYLDSTVAGWREHFKINSHARH